MTQKMNTMKDLPISEMPYEKCMRFGASSLSDAQLLAVIIKTGTKNRTSLTLAQEILQLLPGYGGLLALHHVKLKDLMQIKGIGKVKAIQLLCVAELSKRLARQTKEHLTHLCNPGDVAAYFMEEMRNLETEHLYAAFLDASGHLLHEELVFKGTIQSSIVSPRELLRLALSYDAAHYIILHNHPGGDPTPSPEDINITRRLSKASKVIGIPLMDHIIIGDNQYISLKEQGYL